MSRLIIAGILVPALLTGCAPGSPLFGTGTFLRFAGPICGTADPIMIELSDAKDRSGFAGKVTVTGPDGSTCEITLDSSDSSASAAIVAQAQAVQVLSEKFAAAFAAGALP